MTTTNRRLEKILRKNDIAPSYKLLAEIDRDELDEEMSFEELRKIIDKKGILLQPLFLIDHSGISISTSSFNDPWDSGQVGFIYLLPETIEKEWGSSPEDIQRAKSYMGCEVEVYDDYLRGEVYSWGVEETGESVSGYYGHHGIEDALNEAKSSIDWEVKNSIKLHLRKVKERIKNKVPLIYRQPLQIVQ